MIVSNVVSAGASADTCSIARTGNTDTAERLKVAAAPTLAANHRDQPGLSTGHRADASRLTRSLELCVRIEARTRRMEGGES